MRFLTPGLHGHAVEFSPFFPDRLAVTACQNFGIKGGAELLILRRGPLGALKLETSRQWTDSLTDVRWSEKYDSQLLTSSGDGSLQLWDLSLPATAPPRRFKEHVKEVNGVDWCQIAGDPRVVTASWDGTLKIWDFDASPTSLQTLTGHVGYVYCGIWSPRMRDTIASVSADCSLRVWDSRLVRPTLAQQASDYELLACDWSNYDEFLIFTGGVDKVIRGFDLRNLKRGPMFELHGHKYGVRRLKASPHVAGVVASCSFDFTTRIWDIASRTCILSFEDHSEFVSGIDFNLHVPGELADCAWDQQVVVRNY
eukprot:m.113000 g.113000  ORF g.113000 m.113000 type:complete len:311 (-) comp51855_c0_seq1:587-1519(-)